MAEGRYTLRMLTTADTGGLEAIDKGMQQLGRNAEQLGKLFEHISRTGIGSSKINLSSIIQAAPLLIEAWDLGTKIGTQIGEAVTRIGERGFSLDNLLGKYDARYDESIQRWRQSIRQLVEDLGKEPPQTLLDHLDKLGSKLADIIDKQNHLAQLERTRAQHARDLEKQELDRQQQKIKDDPTLTDAQKDRALRDIALRRESLGFEERQDQRQTKVQSALTQEAQTGKRAEALAQALAEQRRRVIAAAKHDQELEYSWTSSGNIGGIHQGEGATWAEEQRKARGWKSTSAEKAIEDKIAADLARARKARDDAQRESWQALETARLGDENDAELTRKRRAHLIEDENTRQLARIPPSDADRTAAQQQQNIIDAGDSARRAALNEGLKQANPAISEEEIARAIEAAETASEEIGTAANKLATATADSSKRIAANVTQMSADVSRGLSTLETATANNSRAITQIASRLEQVAQLAQAALQATADARNTSRPFNR